MNYLCRNFYKDKNILLNIVKRGNNDEKKSEKKKKKL